LPRLCAWSLCIDLDTESERKLFGNPLIAETGIPALHLKNGVDQLG
jgi:hypothetical protein